MFICGPQAVNQRIVVNGRPVYFDFDRRFGPLVVDARGEPMKRQPLSEGSAFWPPFQEWLARWSAENPEPPTKPYVSEQWDNRRVVPFSPPFRKDRK